MASRCAGARSLRGRARTTRCERASEIRPSGESGRPAYLPDNTGAVVGLRLRTLDRVDEMAGQGTAGGHYRGARHGGLCDSRAAQRLRGALAAAAGHEVDPLFDPYSELAGTSDVSNGHRRQRKERRHGRALELAPAHLAA